MDQPGRIVSVQPNTVDQPDAMVLLSFGGPNGPDDVIPFLTNVTAGRGIPPERLAEVGEHYFAVGGVSPINQQNLTLLAALRGALQERGFTGPVQWGNRNWEPYLTDVVRDLVQAGARRIRVLTTSAYSSYSSCRQYRENVADALTTLAEEPDWPGGVEVEMVGQFYAEDGFVAANAAAVERALTELPPGSRVVFVTHSIPHAMSASSTPVGARNHDAGAGTPAVDDLGGDYVAQHVAVARAVLDRIGRADPVDLAYCSRSGPPTQPWLEPDINDRLAQLAGQAEGVVVAPIGFISDHMEVAYDLDTEAAETATALGLPFRRAATVGVSPDFVAALADRLMRPSATPAITAAGLPQVAGRCGSSCCPALRRAASQPAR